MKAIETVKLKTGRNLRTTSQSPRHFRRLKWDELVTSGDYVVNENRRFEPWEGPSGFRADAFLKPIYRRKKR
jgi:hypothetical protein